MSKRVYVRVVHDLIIMFFVVRSNDSFNFPLGLIKYMVIVIVLNPTDKTSKFVFHLQCRLFLTELTKRLNSYSVIALI